jgi:ribosomal protein L13
MKSENSKLSQKRLGSRLIHECETLAHSPKNGAQYVFIDLSQQAVGRTMSVVANVLNNKYDPDFSFHSKHAHKVVLYNCSNVVLTGNKMHKKSYIKYTGYAGGQREILFKTIFEKNPRTALDLVLRRMFNDCRSRNKKMQQIMYCAQLPDSRLSNLRNDNNSIQKTVNMILGANNESKI